MRARQLQWRDKDLQEATLHLQRSRKQEKEEFNARKQLRIKELNIGDLVLLHNTKLKFQFSHKLDFRWTGMYRIANFVEDKRIYFLEELNGARLQGTFAGNWLKFFHVWNHNIKAADSQETTTNQRRDKYDGEDRICLPRIRLCFHLAGSWAAEGKERTEDLLRLRLCVWLRAVAGKNRWGSYRLNAATSFFHFFPILAFFSFFRLFFPE